MLDRIAAIGLAAPALAPHPSRRPTPRALPQPFGVSSSRRRADLGATNTANGGDDADGGDEAKVDGAGSRRRPEPSR